MVFATKTDLLAIDPSLDPTPDYADDLMRASADVERMVRIRWRNVDGYNSRRRLGRIHANDSWDASKLDASQWMLSTVYRALACYIYPKLTQFASDGDQNQIRLDFYMSRYQDEISSALDDGIRYDRNDDDVYDDTERIRATSRFRVT